MWLRNDVLRTFESLIQDSNCDIIESQDFLSAERKAPESQSSKHELKIISPDEYYSSIHHPCIVTSVYRKSLIDNILFREHVYYEDTDWKIRVYTHAQRIGITNYTFYNYCENIESTTHVKSANLFRDALTANILCRKAYMDSPLSNSLKNKILKSGAKHYINLLLDLRNYKWGDAKNLIRDLIDTPPIKNHEFSYSLKEEVIIGIAQHLPYLFLCGLFNATKLKRFMKKKR